MGFFDGFTRAASGAKRLEEAKKRQQANPTSLVMANALIDALIAAGDRNGALDVISRSGAALHKAGRPSEALALYGRTERIDPGGELSATFLLQRKLQELRDEANRAAETVAAEPRRDSGTLRIPRRDSGVMRLPGQEEAPAVSSSTGAIAPVARMAVLKELPQPLLERLLPALTPRQVEAGTAVFQEGAEGDALFFVVAGQLSLRAGEQVLATIGPGDVAGEISFLGAPTRPATLVAVKRAELLELSRAAAAAVPEAVARLSPLLQRLARERALEAALARSRVFAGLPPEERSRLAARFFHRAARAGSRLVSEGDSDTTFFLLLKGELRLSKQHAGREIVLATLTSSECFGDVGALHGTARTRSATAASPVEYAGLTREDLLEVIGRHPRVKEALDEVQMERFFEEARILTG